MWAFPRSSSWRVRWTRCSSWWPELLREIRSVIDPAEVSAYFDRYRGNVRDVFFALYDLYEQRRNPTPQFL